MSADMLCYAGCVVSSGSFKLLFIRAEDTIAQSRVTKIIITFVSLLPLSFEVSAVNYEDGTNGWFSQLATT